MSVCSIQKIVWGAGNAKLLDLSLRNNLLNFKAGKKSLKLESPDPAALEDILASGKKLKLLTRPDLMDGADPRDQALYELREREDVRRLHALDALKRHEVFVGLSSTEMEARLIELYRGARTALQEGGSNTLYLALGFLSWERADKGGQKYRAPLVLIPVTLERKSARSGFSMVLHDDEPRFNPTLIEMLRQDFELNLGSLETELPRDDSGLDIDAIWKAVGRAVKDIAGWEVVEDVVLSMFSFRKIFDVERPRRECRSASRKSGRSASAGYSTRRFPIRHYVSRRSAPGRRLQSARSVLPIAI